MKKVKYTFIFFTTFLFSFNNAWANNCSEHNANHPSVPLCPAGGGVLSEIYPARMAFVSTDIGGPDFAANVAREVMGSQASRPPVIVVTAPPIHCEQVREKVSQSAPPQYRETWANNIECNSRGKRWNWQQDFAQGYVRSNGTPFVRFNNQYYDGRESNAFRGLPEIVQNCGFESETADMGSTNAEMGGNIEGMPPDICVLGDNVASADRNRLCDNADKVIAPTDYMAVGHVDEIMKTIKTEGSPPCNFKILVGSIDLGKSLLAGQTNPQFIPRPNELTSNICKEGLKEARNNSRPAPHRSGTVTLNWLLFGGKTMPSHAGATPLNPAEPDSGPVTCTPQEFLRGVDQLYGDLNNGISEKLNNFANALTNKMRSKNPQCGNVVERVPMLFQGTHGQNDAQSIFPNPTNSLSVNRSLIYSDPNNAIYDNYLADITSNMGLRKRNINTDSQHALMGNLHCSTNLLRYCRPR